MKLIHKYLSLVVNRRRYTRLISNSLTMRKKMITMYNFMNAKKYYGSLIIESTNLEKLKSCKKSGTWIQVKFLGKSFTFWTSIERAYFKNNSNFINTVVANNDLVKTAKMEVFQSVKVIHNKKDAISLNLYNSKIKKSIFSKNNEKAFYLNIKGSDSFQHFVAEALPILGLARNFLINEPEIQIVMPQPLLNFKSQRYFFDRLGITNPIKYIDEETLYFKELYIINFKPLNAIYAIPSTLYKDVYSFIHQNQPNQITRLDNLVVFMRNEKTRNFANSNEIRWLFEKHANKLNLNPIFVDSNTMQVENLMKILQNAKYVFGVHGGANYNMIWANQNTTLIEFIPTGATDSLQHLVLSVGQHYFPYALDANKGDFNFRVSNSDLDRIFVKLLMHD